MNIYSLIFVDTSFNTQTALSSLIEKWKQIIDNNGYGTAIFMDLIKAFDTIMNF